MKWLCKIIGHGKMVGILDWNDPEKNSRVQCKRCGELFANGSGGIRMGVAGPDDPIHEHFRRCIEKGEKWC